MMEKILEIIKKYSYTIAIGLFAVVLACMAIGSFACDDKKSKNKGNDDGSKPESEIQVSQELPEFFKSPDSSDISDGYAAYYYSDVTEKDVLEYISKLEKELGIKFENEIYPKTADCGDKIIAIHYGVTEKRLSVTVAEKEN